MSERASAGGTSALAVAEVMADVGGMDFRTAHHTLGSLIGAVGRRAFDREVLETVVPQWRHATASLVPAAVALASVHGGGPGRTAGEDGLDDLCDAWRDQARRARSMAQRWRDAAKALDRAVAAVCGEPVILREIITPIGITPLEEQRPCAHYPGVDISGTTCGSPRGACAKPPGFRS
jgi:hypothetical protein